jgi:arylsulfatase A-like enzyme
MNEPFLEKIRATRTLQGSRWIVLPALAAATAGYALLPWQRHLHHATTTAVVIPTPEVEATADILRSLETLERRSVMATFARIPATAGALADAARGLGRAASDFRGYRVDASVIPETNILRIDVEGPDAGAAAALANGLATATKREIRSLYRIFTLRTLTRPTTPPHPSRPDAGGDTGRPRSVILIGVDTLGAGHLGLYGSRRPTSPFLDRHARSGMVFDRAFSTSPWTLPSFASMFTGLLPSGHGVHVVLRRESREHALEAAGPRKRPSRSQRRFAKLAASVPTLAEILAASGFTTTAIVQNPILRRDFGLDRGFGVYDFQAGDNVSHRKADAVVARALESVDRHRLADRRFFLFVHLFDPHLNYDAPKPFRGVFTRGIKSRLKLPVQGAKSIRGMISSLTPADRQFIEAAHDEEVLSVDEQLRLLFEGLQARELDAEALVILTSDHGEEFFEHGGFEHGHTMFNELLRVPLIVWGPGVAAGRESAPVSVADIAPTILDAVGVERSATMFGVSLWPLLRDRRAIGRRPLLAESTMYGSEQKTLILWPHKLVVGPAEGQRALFDIAADPGETDDLLPAQPELAASLGEMLERLAADRGPASGEAMPPEVAEALHALGYVQ